MSLNSRATRRAVEAANEYHRRAEMQRRAMMTPEQRAAFDHAIEVESVHETGQREANLRAFTVVMVGVIAAVVAGASPAGWWLGLPVLVGTVAVMVWVYRARMQRLAAELDAIEGIR
jgi:fatty acid desaturase